MDAVGTDATTSRLPRIVAIIAAVGFAATGLGALIAPEAFFESLATFEPYNRHFIQDIGAFNIGLAAMTGLAVRRGADALFVVLAGGAVAGAAHLVSHLVGLDLGGQPATDIPFFALLTGLLAAAAVVRGRDVRR